LYFDEDMVFSALSTETSVAAAVALRTASAYMVMDAFDRDVPRDFFIEIVSNAFSFNEKVQVFENIKKVEWDLQEGNFSTAHLKKFENTLMAHVEKLRKSLVAKMDLIRQMPVAGEDTIN